MNQYMPLYDLLAGGPGSGCHGGNCGRPSLSSTKKEFTTSSGAKYTIYQPSRKGIARGSSGYVRQSEYKGKFKDRDFTTGKYRKTDDVAGFEGRNKRVAAVYNANWPKHDVYALKGLTVFVHRDFEKNRVVIQEVHHEAVNKNAMATPEVTKSKQYVFKNFGKAAGFLNKKFGIRQALPNRKLPAADVSELTKKYPRKRGASL